MWRIGGLVPEVLRTEAWPPRSSCPSARPSSAPLAASAGTQDTLLAMSAVGIACALCFLAAPSVRRLPRVEAAVADQ